MWTYRLRRFNVPRAWAKILGKIAFDKLTFAEKQEKNWAIFCQDASSCADHCRLCGWPLDSLSVQGAIHGTLCLVCSSMIQILSQRAYWVNLISNEANKRRQMGLDNPNG